MTDLIKQGERLDDLQRNNLYIIQNKALYRFSADSVLLSDFAKVGKGSQVVEFCSGSGVISILVNDKYKPDRVVGFEIVGKMCDMATRSVQYNGIKNVKFINDDLKNAHEYVKNVDAVICNPPYYKKLADYKNVSPRNVMAKYESTATLEDIFVSARKILKTGGSFYMVHTPLREEEILLLGEKYNFDIKRYENGTTYLLVEFVKL